MTRLFRLVAVGILCIFAVHASFAQVASGKSPFGSFGGGPDVVDLGNLNVQIAVPVMSKPGRGMSLHYTLTYDSSIWYPAAANGILTWTPVSNWGWRSQTEALMGYVTYKTTTRQCLDDSIPKPQWVTGTIYNSFEYHDEFGVIHYFGLSPLPYIDDDSSPCAQTNTSVTGTAIDGSGFSISANNSGFPIAATVTSSSGGYINAPIQNPSASGSQTDANGNEISTTGTTITDTLQTTALSISGSPQSGPMVYTLQNTGGSTRQVTVYYQTYTVQTNFQCDTGHGSTQTVQDYPATSVPLVDHIVMPDGTEYQFSYEDTVGVSGAKTGRISQIKLPTGGTIDYNYTGGDCPNGGIQSIDGSTPQLTRAMTDGTWTYARSGSGNSWTTTVTDPASNQTTINFEQDASTSNTHDFFETQRQVYQGSVDPSHLLATVYTCYNGSSYPCATSSVSLPVSSVVVTTNQNNSFKQARSTYDATYGYPLNTYEYDYGSGSPGSLLRETDRSYTTVSGPLATFFRPSDISVKNGTGGIVSEVSYSFDGSALSGPTSSVQHDDVDFPYTRTTGRGNATTVRVCVSAAPWSSCGSWAATANTYDDTGNLLTSSDPLGHETQYIFADSYSDSTNHHTNALLTQITYPNTGVDHKEEFAYYYPSALLQASTDQNNQQTGYVYDSANRPTSITYPDGGKTSYNYANAQQVEVQKLISGSSCSSGVCTDSWTEVDGLGRPSRTATANGELGTGTSPWDQIDTCYSPTQEQTAVSYAYQGSGIANSPNGSKQCTSGATAAYDTTTYDALGRATSVTHSTDTSHSITYSYYGRAMSVQDEGDGDGVGTRITHVYQHNGLGQTVSVCEGTSASWTVIGSSGSAGTCGLDIAESGFITTYTYDPLGNVLAVTQGSLDQRTFTYDGMSHLLSEVIPEANDSTTTYTYNADGTLHTRVRPSPNQNSGYTTTTTYSYDADDRLTQISYSDSNPSPPYATQNAAFYYDESSIWGVNPQYPTGRMTHMTGAGGYASDILSYDKMGRVANDWQCTPHNCGTGSWLLSYTYNLDGTMATSTNGWGVTFTYTSNIGQRLTRIDSSLADNNHPGWLIQSVHYNALGQPVSDSLGNGVNETAQFDTRGRFQYLSAVNGSNTTVYSINNATTPVSYTPDSNIAGANDSANGNWVYTYDPMNRISSAAQSGGVNLTFSNAPAYGSTIDRYANLWQQYVNGANPAPNNTQTTDETNHISGNTYDAAGNITQWNDGTMTHTYTYDAEGRLVSIDSNSIQYSYDAIGRRVEKNVQGTKDDYIYDLQGNVVAEMDGTSGEWNRGEIWAAGRHLATYANSTTYFSHADWLGTERVRTDVNGNILQSCTSNPYGDSLSCSSEYPTTYTPYNYAGMEYDPETGFYHTQFRYYNPKLGSWMTPDPAGMAAADLSNPQSLNRYAYVGNSPTNAIDPTGMVTYGSITCDGGSCYMSQVCIGDGGPCAGGDGGGGFGFGIGLSGLGLGDLPLPGSEGNVPIGNVNISDLLPKLPWPNPMIWDAEKTAQNPPCLVGAGPLLPTQSRCGSWGGTGAAQYQTYQGLRLVTLLGKGLLGAGEEMGGDYMCSDSPSHNIRNYALEGISKGAVAGAYEVDQISPGAPAIEGAIYAAWVGGVFGTALGAVASAACSALGVY